MDVQTHTYTQRENKFVMAFAPFYYHMLKLNVVSFNQLK